MRKRFILRVFYFVLVIAFSTSCTNENNDKHGNKSEPITLPGWNTFQGNVEHTGYVPIHLDPAQFSTRWQRPGDSTINSTPSIVVDGYIFNARFQNNADGQLLKIHSVSARVERASRFTFVQSLSAASYENGIIVYLLNSSQPYLFIIDAKTGKRLFDLPVPTNFASDLSPSLFVGNIYINATYASIIFRSGVTLREAWLPSATKALCILPRKSAT